MTNMSWLKRLSKCAGNHAPELLIGAGIAAGVAAVVTAVSATFKAAKAIDKRKAAGKEISRKEIVKTVWKDYIPTAGALIVSAGCFIAANAVHNKRAAALAAAYAISETALTNYKQSVLENVGEEKEREIADKAVQKQIIETPVDSTEVIRVGDNGVLVYDEFAGRYFRSDKNGIIRAVNELNRMIINDESASLNDFYDLVGLDYTIVGESLGWNCANGSVEVRFSSHLTADGEPCLAYSFATSPKMGFNDYPF